MKHMSRDVYISIIFLIISILVFSMSLNMQALTTSAVGADFLPKVIAILIFVLSSYFLIVSIKNPVGNVVDDTDEMEEINDSDESKKFTRVLLTGLLMIIYVFLINFIGFILASILYLTVQMVLFSSVTKRNIIVYLLISIVTSVFIYFVFRNIFYVMLPSGILG
ncbi:tripartite tricarboxylate transporter TctB family protein [Pseudogracilibacillus sp. ICA-222130]|uniref:tripartite tricarboxylate transporter TctB family protein n=1 Tax=Pseudogracilibacillus sp. ICA-222130 TaxID=3134655 RepID=UPI0030C04170